MYIRRVNENDYKVLRLLGDCGHVATNTLLWCGISASRIKYLRRTGLICSHTYLEKSGQKSLKQAWTTTGEGRRFIKDYCRITPVNTHQAVRHGLALSEEYAVLVNSRGIKLVDIYNELDVLALIKQKVETYRNNSETYRLLADYNNNPKGYYRMPDLTFRSQTGELICIEIVTKTYSDSKRESKARTADFLGAEYIEIDIH